MPDFTALVATKTDDGVDCNVTTLSSDDLPDGDVMVRVAWSGVNYKDGLAVTPKGHVAEISPLVPGIDLAGEVVESTGDGVAAGSAVLAHGYDLGVARHGGYAEYARVPSEWVIRLPDGLTAREAMAIGTAGYTAALSVHALEERGIAPDQGPVLVLGATGGVGSAAVSMLAGRGYEVWAATGKSEDDYLERLGAAHIITRDEAAAESDKPMESERWAACVDPVGGPALAAAIRAMRYGGAVASSGMTGGATFTSSVFPFILRNVALLGIDSVQTPMERRRQVWERLGGDLRPVSFLEHATDREVSLEELGDVLEETLAGKARGRTLVRLAGG